jgi:hypothetical protein
MDGCSSLRQLPDTIGQLTALSSLSIAHCSSLQRLPASLAMLCQVRHQRPAISGSITWVLMDVPMYFVYRDGQYINALGQSWRDFMAGKLAGLPGGRADAAGCQRWLGRCRWVLAAAGWALLGALAGWHGGRRADAQGSRCTGAPAGAQRQRQRQRQHQSPARLCCGLGQRATAPAAWASGGRCCGSPLLRWLRPAQRSAQPRAALRCAANQLALPGPTRFRRAPHATVRRACAARPGAPKARKAGP